MGAITIGKAIWGLFGKKEKKGYTFAGSKYTYGSEASALLGKSRAGLRAELESVGWTGSIGQAIEQIQAVGTLAGSPYSSPVTTPVTTTMAKQTSKGCLITEVFS